MVAAPDFLLIGAAKSGTTALYRALRAHPAVFMPDNKEPHYFAFAEGPLSFGNPRDGERHTRTITSWAAYQRLFADRRPGQLAGEASTYSLCSPIASGRIRDTVPDARLIAILRDPVRRAHANYLHLVRQGFETAATFEEGLARERERIEQGWDFFWHYRALGYYHRQLSPYFGRFARDRIKVVLYEDFERDPADVVRSIFTFLGVDPAFTPDLSRRVNRSGVPRSRRLQRLLTSPPRPVRWLARRWMPVDRRRALAEVVGRVNLQRPVVAAATRQELRAGYRADIEALEALLERPLSSWLREEGGPRG